MSQDIQGNKNSEGKKVTLNVPGTLRVTKIMREQKF